MRKDTAVNSSAWVGPGGFCFAKTVRNVLNQGGESWIADKLATWERTFPLYDLLTKYPPDFDQEGLAVYFAAKNPEIKVNKLTHFAIGMFWKASVHSWSGTQSEPRINLGPYSEKIRTWLRGENEFPRHMYLIAVVSRPLSCTDHSQ